MFLAATAAEGSNDKPPSQPQQPEQDKHQDDVSQHAHPPLIEFGGEQIQPKPRGFASEVRGGAFAARRFGFGFPVASGGNVPRVRISVCEEVCVDRVLVAFNSVGKELVLL